VAKGRSVSCLSGLRLFVNCDNIDKKVIEMKSILFILVVSIFLPVVSQVPENGMVLIPAGAFTMGRNTANPTDWQPEHKVRVDAFYMDKYEVTNREYYDYCMKTKTSLPFFWGMVKFSSGIDFPDHPVVGISNFEAEKYAKWAGKRLPTEAEWEYAARGGLAGKNYPWGDGIDSLRANYGRKYGTLLKVGSFAPNGYGVYDIGGNVWEWTSDNYGADYYSASPGINPKGPERGRFKVIRGGSWHSGAMCIQTCYRNGLSPSWVDFAVGFRCVKDVK
jgi:formylglycine-generating enzyme required for sulfatase activity